MKRRDLVRYLSYQGCKLVREAASHSIWENPKNQKRISIPRVIEIPDFTSIRICRNLEIAYKK